MFIVCPSCSGPYSIPAGQIAPLVQVACPHCEYRIILDFEAANDPALREPGHQFAQGYESAEAYFSVYSHVTKNPDAKPFQNPGISAGQIPAEIKQAVNAASEPAKSPTPAPTSTAATPAAQLGTPPNVGLFKALGDQPAQAGSSRNAKTVIHTGSKKPVAIDPGGEGPLAPRPKTPSGPTMHPGGNTEKLPDAPPPSITPVTVPPPVATAEPERRNPPHTPPATNAATSAPPEAVKPAETKPEDPAAQSHSQLDKKPEVPAIKTPEPIKPTETSSAPKIIIGIVVLILIVLAVLWKLNQP